MSSFCKPKKHRSIANTNGKCGEITYHLQVGKRVYVLNCLFCPQIQIQWDNFINHMEQEHDEELDQLLQKASRSKSSSKEHTVTAIPSFAETSKSTNEFEDNCQLSKVEVNCDPLVIAGTDNLAPISTIKAETYEFVDQSFEIPAEVRAEKHDQTYSTLDEEQWCEGDYETLGTVDVHGEDDEDDIMDINKMKLTEMIIHYYKEHSVLWDTSESGYGNNLKNLEAYKNITKLINKRMNTLLKWPEIKTEIDKLKTQFRKEYKILTDFTQNLDNDYGSDDCDESIQTSKAQPSWLYEKLNFLQDHMGCEKSRSKRSVESGRFVQTAFGENKSFIEISEPYEYDVFVAEAAMEFNINNAEDIVVSVNGTKMKRPQFKSIVLQYSNTPSFQFDITIKDSVQYTSWYDSGTESLPTKSIINSVNIPDIHSIKSLKTVHNLLIEFLAGKPLRNKDRVNIAKAIIDECLKDIPNRVLSREDFTALAEAIVSIFDSEVVSAYYIPSMKSYPARGKLWSAYNNKRTALSLNGIISRRSKITLKRKSSTSPSSSVETVFNSIQYLQQQDISDWSTILCKWSETHGFRMSEIKNNITTYDYINKYPGLQGVKGLELVNMDVLILYPSSSSVENWLTLYPKVISRARILRDKNVCQLIAEIDGSSDERFRAQLTLMLIPYILQHCGKRSENNSGNATKFEIQERFIKEYKSIAELNKDTKSADLQFRFVKDTDAVTYAEFKIAGYTFKCKDLLEALNIGFMYITALNVTYPKLCTHVWQFIQLSIFQIHLPDIKVPNIETIVNDLYKEI